MQVKIQLPIGGDVGAALIYTEDRSVVMQVPVSAVAKRFARGEVKGYFEAAVEGDVLEVGERLPNLGW